MNNYDQTKRMLNVLRNLNESKSSSKTLKESTFNSTDPSEFTSNKEQMSSQNSDRDITNINDMDVKILNKGELTEEQKNAISQIVDNFREQVSQIVEFDPGMTISENQIRMDGNLTDEDVKFTYIAGQEEGLYINAEMLKIEQEIVDVISKLSKFEITFKTSVEPMITSRNNDLQ